MAVVFGQDSGRNHLGSFERFLEFIPENTQKSQFNSVEEL